MKVPPPPLSKKRADEKLKQSPFENCAKSKKLQSLQSKRNQLLPARKMFRSQWLAKLNLAERKTLPGKSQHKSRNQPRVSRHPHRRIAKCQARNKSPFPQLQ